MLFMKPIYDSIIFTLAQSKGLSIQWLHKLVYEQEKISLPNFYKIIDQMIEKQIILKENWKIALHATRMLSLFDLTEKIKKQYFEQPTVSIELKENEQKVFYASSLRDLDNVRANLLSAISIKYTKNEHYYFYNAHTYHILWMQETERTNFQQFGKYSPKVYFVSGNETPLDIYWAQLLGIQGTNAICSDKVKFLKDGYCLNVIWEYIVEVLFPPMITNYFKVFFDSIKTIKDFNPELFQNIFKMKSECKLTIRRNKKDAEIFKKEIIKYFK